MLPSISHLITCTTAEFNSAPLEALKKLDNELFQIPFYSGKVKIKTESKTLDFAVPLNSQFNLFKTRQFEIAENLIVVDISPASLHHCGEDDFCVQDDKVLEICRRGFCVLLNCATKEQRILRLGLRKFFYLDVNELLSPKNSQSFPPQKGEQKNKNAPESQNPRIDYITIHPIRSLASKGVPFRMIGTSKLNGENLQITFDAVLKAWVVCSKNVTVVTLDFTDLDRYKNNMAFEVAIRIVEKWRKTLSQIGPAREAELKEVLASNRWSLMGEICGNIRMMHPVHYETEDLYFYAVSVCEFGRSCLNPGQSNNLFEHMGLRHIKPLFEDVIAGEKDLVTKLPAAVDMVNGMFADRVGEGVVVYFCSLEENAESFLLIKVKSLEYVIFRKLREKLKRAVPPSADSDEEEEDKEAQSGPAKNPKGKPKGLVRKEVVQPDGRFTPEVHKALKELIPAIQKLIPAKSLRSSEYYSQLCLKAFYFIRDPKAAGKFWLNFPCFIRALQFAIDRNLTLTAENFDSIVNIVWSLSVRFYKLEPHLKMFPFVETVRPEATRKPFCSFNNSIPKHVKVVVPVSILGSGKSYMFEKLACLYRDQGWVTFLLSSDELSAHVIERRRFVDNDFNPKKDYFESSRTEYRNLWKQYVDQVFVRVLDFDAPRFVILVDKNHHPFHYRKILKEYAEKLGKLGFTCDFVHVYSECLFPMEWSLPSGTRFSNPIGPKLFYDSFVRINGRKDNVLMQDCTPERNLQVLSDFFSFFIDYNPRLGNPRNTVFFRCYDESDPEFVGKVDAALGPALQAFLQAKKAGEKLTEKYLKDIHAKFNDFYVQNCEKTTQHLFPSIDDFEDSLEANCEALFGSAMGLPPSDLNDIDGMAFGGFFIEPKSFENLCIGACRDIHSQLQEQNIKDADALRFVHGVATQGLFRKEWQVVRHPHMTSVFLGGNPPIPEASEVWKRCVQSKNLNLELVAMVYAASKLAFFLVKPTLSPFTLNKVAHVSILCAGRYTFYDSNRVAQALLTQGVDLYASHSAMSTHLIEDLYEQGTQTKVHIFRMAGSSIAATLRKMYG